MNSLSTSQHVIDLGSCWCYLQEIPVTWLEFLDLVIWFSFLLLYIAAFILGYYGISSSLFVQKAENSESINTLFNRLVCKKGCLNFYIIWVLYYVSVNRVCEICVICKVLILCVRAKPKFYPIIIFLKFKSRFLEVKIVTWLWALYSIK